jgi:hypothetical protein
MTLLSVVEDAFEIADRGTVVVPHLQAQQRWPASLSLELRRPDGTKVVTQGHVRLEHLLRRPPGQSEWVWTLCLDVPKRGAPPGTEVWELEPSTLPGSE